MLACLGGACTVTQCTCWHKTSMWYKMCCVCVDMYRSSLYRNFIWHAQRTLAELHDLQQLQHSHVTA